MLCGALHVVLCCVVTRCVALRVVGGVAVCCALLMCCDVWCDVL